MLYIFNAILLNNIAMCIKPAKKYIKLAIPKTRNNFAFLIITSTIIISQEDKQVKGQIILTLNKL